MLHQYVVALYALGMDGTTLTARRDALGMSKAELGRRLDVTQNTIARWETGAVTMQRPRMLDLALRCLELEHAGRLLGVAPVDLVKDVTQGDS